MFLETADHLERWRTTLTSQDGIARGRRHRRRRRSTTPRFVTWDAFVAAAAARLPHDEVDARTAALHARTTR